MVVKTVLNDFIDEVQYACDKVQSWNNWGCMEVKDVLFIINNRNELYGTIIEAKEGRIREV